MVDIVYTPQWFYGKDIVIDIFSLIVLLLIAYFAFNYYRINKNKKNLILASAFTMIGLSFFFKILTNFTIYYHVLETKRIGFITFTYNTVKPSDTLFIVGFLIFRLLMLIGFYMVYSLYKKQPKTNILLIAYLLIVSTYYSVNAYYIFHLTALILHATISWELYKNYQKTQVDTARLLMISFFMITLSHMAFIYIGYYHVLYVLAEIIQAIAYTLLLITFIQVLTHAKKKK